MEYKLDHQKTELLLILLKAVVEYPFTGIEDEKNKLKTEVLKILSKRV